MTYGSARRATKFRPVGWALTPVVSRVVALLAVAVLIVATIPSVVGATTPSRRPVKLTGQCPWIKEDHFHSATAQQMAAQVVQQMTPWDLANFVVLHDNGVIENYNVGVPHLCIPALTLVDGPSGVGGGANQVTQFPSELSVAASFNPLTARQVGYAMAREALVKGYSVLQAPDLNLVRSPLDGRAFETYGEDPFLASVMGVAAIEGIQSTGVIAQAKHLGAYTQENGRARLDQIVSARVLHEVYDAPFQAAVQQGHVASIMCAMGSLNGVNTCSSPGLYATLRSWGFHGFVRSDYAAVTLAAPAFRAGVSLVKPATGGQVLSAVTKGLLRLSALRRSVESVLTEMFAFGLVMNQRSPALWTRATSVAHTEIALRAARQGIVLLQNINHVLPLPAHRSVAVIGIDAREGVITRGGGSSGVQASALETPLAALKKMMKGSRITYEPGGSNGLEFDPLKITDVTSGTVPVSQLPIIVPGRLGKGDVAIDYAKSVTPAALTATTPGSGEGWSNWDVTFRAEKTGAYVLGLVDDGDAWLSLNDTTILADRGIHGPSPQSTSVHLVAGHNYTLVARWFAINANTSPRLGVDFIQPKIDAALAAAKKAHTAVVFASNLLSEGADATTLYLQGGLNALISAVAAVNPRTVVVLNTGGPILMPWKSKVEGIVEAWYGGQMSGPAIAQVLTGVVDPSGRLPVTMPASPNQTPATSVRQYPGVNGVVNFGGLSDLGYRWYQTHSVTPAFAFGYGLSYTSFHWSNINVVSGVPGGGSTQGVTHGTHGSEATVSLTVTNTGPRDGASVVQVYVSYPARLGEPPEQLRGFASVDLAPGATKNVVITLPTSAFSYFNGHSMVVATGSYGVNVATSSANIVASQSLNIS